jgi:hypothetical protein
MKKIKKLDHYLVQFKEDGPVFALSAIGSELQTFEGMSCREEAPALNWDDFFSIEHIDSDIFIAA